MAQGEGFADAAEDGDLMGDQPGQADGVQAHAAELRAAPAGDGFALGFAAGEVGVARFAHRLGGGDRGARGGVDLAVVVLLDDLDRVEEGGGDAGEVHHHHRAEREVGGDDSAQPALRAGALGLRDERVGQAGGADHRPHAGRDCGGQ